jgi:hypothetical protein
MNCVRVCVLFVQPTTFQPCEELRGYLETVNLGYKFDDLSNQRITMNMFANMDVSMLTIAGIDDAHIDMIITRRRTLDKTQPTDAPQCDDELKAFVASLGLDAGVLTSLGNAGVLDMAAMKSCPGAFFSHLLGTFAAMLIIGQLNKTDNALSHTQVVFLLLGVHPL